MLVLRKAVRLDHEDKRDPYPMGQLARKVHRTAVVSTDGAIGHVRFPVHRRR